MSNPLRGELKVSRAAQEIDKHTYYHVMVLNPHRSSLIRLEIDISREFLIIHCDDESKHGA
jgi:hypothetical protein